ncbi:MAG: helix-turn-helix transcriptional regulator [Longimicrobiales bacterium]
MGGSAILGSFEEHVLLAVARGRSDAYGMTVRRDIQERTSRDVSIGAVYATLDRLETKGLVRSRLDHGDPERRGRARRFFSLTPEGADALRLSLEQHRRMWDGLDPAALPGDAG